MSETFTLPDDVSNPLNTEVHFFGTPFHGLCEAGTLTLPNSDTMTVPQPTGGSTYVERVPGISPVSRTPAEQAADTAAGKAWLDYGILAGHTQRLYGFNLGPLGWIYCSAADDKRWWIRLTSASAITGNSQTFTFSVKLFGVIGGTVEEYTRTVTLSDIGQSTPTVTWHSSSETGTGIYDYTVNTYDLYLEDISQDGSAAVLGLHNRDPAKLLNWTPNWWAGEPVSMGFLLVSIIDGSSGPEISVSVLYTRETALGSYSFESEPAGYTVDNRIIGVWFDGATPHPVKLAYSFPDLNDYDPFDTEPPYPISDSSSASAIGTATITLTWNAQEAVFSCEGSDVRSGSISIADETTLPADYGGSGSGAYSYTFESGLIAGSAGYEKTEPWAAHSRLWPLWLFGAWSSDFGGLTCNIPQAYHGCGIFKADTYDYESPAAIGDRCYWALKRLNNKQFGIIGMRFAPDTDPQGGNPFGAWTQTNDMIWLGGFTPAGKDALQGDLGVHSNIVPKGAVHPTTGIPVLRPDGTAICYV